MRALFATLAVLLMAGIVALRTRNLRHTQKALEVKVHERTAELEAMTMELQLQQQALEETSVRDPLTGLHNRRYLTQCLDADMAISLRAHEGHLTYGATFNGKQDLLFFMLDIDHFKAVNDSFGHRAGDEVLRQLSGRLKTVFRDTDYLVRWGGEEFLGVVRQTERRTAEDLAERVRAAVSNAPFVLEDAKCLNITCSVGFACFPLDASHPRHLGWADLVNLADAALYTVKRRGRNGWIGVLGCQAMTQEEMQDWIRRPLEEWIASGLVQTVTSESVRQALTVGANT
jgi:diguanylate cyclase (GGDEF)-like protein